METGGLALTAIPTEFRLDGKTAVVTGGGSGIGRAVGLKFAAAGADVRILEINEKSASAVADEIAHPVAALHFIPATLRTKQL